MEFKISLKNRKTVLALGPESDGNFSVYKNGKIFFSQSFGDLLQDTNFNEFKNELNKFFKKENIKPEIILTDLHPLYKTTFLGQEFAKKFKAKHIQVQHHIAHIFSAIGEKMLNTKNYKLKAAIGIACDGTGYGMDGKIWGGEIFKIAPLIKPVRLTRSGGGDRGIERIGHLENQIMIGGDLAVKEPARMLIAILAKVAPLIKGDKGDYKEFVYSFVKKYYIRNEFELLYSQLQQNFNCVETSSTGRVLDAASVLLGFAGNKRNYKHEPIDLLEKNFTKPYNLPPLIKGGRGDFELQTTLLFKYLIKNLHKDKRRLAATAQLYIAQGLHEIIKKSKIKNQKSKMFFAGGIADNKIISSYLENKGVFFSKKIPRGDAGISFGQIIYYLSTDPRN